jgi:hypothetical protein
MKLHLVRLTKSQGQARFPGIEGFEARLFKEPEEVDKARLYLLLEGEAVIDLPDQSYIHLRRNEAANLKGPHKLTPIDPSVIVVWEVDNR